MSYAKLYKREGFELLIDELTKGKKLYMTIMASM